MNASCAPMADALGRSGGVGRTSPASVSCESAMVRGLASIWSGTRALCRDIRETYRLNADESEEQERAVQANSLVKTRALLCLLVREPVHLCGVPHTAPPGPALFAQQ